jgi:hypothetical protein
LIEKPEFVGLWKHHVLESLNFFVMLSGIPRLWYRGVPELEPSEDSLEFSNRVRWASSLTLQIFPAESPKQSWKRINPKYFFIIDGTKFNVWSLRVDKVTLQRWWEIGHITIYRNSNSRNFSIYSPTQLSTSKLLWMKDLL